MLSRFHPSVSSSKIFVPFFSNNPTTRTLEEVERAVAEMDLWNVIISEPPIQTPSVDHCTDVVNHEDALEDPFKVTDMAINSKLIKATIHDSPSLNVNQEDLDDKGVLNYVFKEDGGATRTGDIAKEQSASILFTFYDHTLPSFQKSKISGSTRQRVYSHINTVDQSFPSRSRYSLRSDFEVHRPRLATAASHKFKFGIIRSAMSAPVKVTKCVQKIRRRSPRVINTGVQTKWHEDLQDPEKTDQMRYHAPKQTGPGLSERVSQQRKESIFFTKLVYPPDLVIAKRGMSVQPEATNYHNLRGITVPRTILFTPSFALRNPRSSVIRTISKLSSLCDRYQGWHGLKCLQPHGFILTLNLKVGVIVFNLEVCREKIPWQRDKAVEMIQTMSLTDHLASVMSQISECCTGALRIRIDERFIIPQLRGYELFAKLTCGNAKFGYSSRNEFYSKCNLSGVMDNTEIGDTAFPMTPFNHRLQTSSAPIPVTPSYFITNQSINYIDDVSHLSFNAVAPSAINRTTIFGPHPLRQSNQAIIPSITRLSPRILLAPPVYLCSHVNLVVPKEVFPSGECTSDASSDADPSLTLVLRRLPSCATRAACAYLPGSGILWPQFDLLSWLIVIGITILHLLKSARNRVFGCPRRIECVV